MSRRSIRFALVALLAAAVVVIVADITLNAQRIEQRAPGLAARVKGWLAEHVGAGWTSWLMLDFAANLAMFVPVGIVAYLVLPRRAIVLTLLVSPAAASAIELFQAMYLSMRVASMTDVVAGTIGGTLGVAIAAVGTAIARGRRRSRRSAPVAVRP